jgi:UDP-sugar pyrophosphorylase
MVLLVVCLFLWFIAKGDTLPLAIMTSADTHSRTVDLLEKNDYFGMKKEQVTLM